MSEVVTELSRVRIPSVALTLLRVMSNVINLSKTERAESRITSAKNKVYEFIRKMLEYGNSGIDLNKSQYLDPEKLRTMLSEWLQVDAKADLNHVIELSGEAVKQFTEMKSDFIQSQVDMKLIEFGNALPHLSSDLVELKEVDGEPTLIYKGKLKTALDIYKRYQETRINMALRRVKLATSVQPKKPAAKKKAEKVAVSA